MEVCNSFEMDYKEVDGKIKIDMDYFEVKQEQCMLARHPSRVSLPSLLRLFFPAFAYFSSAQAVLHFLADAFAAMSLQTRKSSRI